jgi:hypothetical protein
MRVSSPRVAGIAALATISALLLGGCHLREGASSEYGGIGVGKNMLTAQKEMGKN